MSCQTYRMIRIRSILAALSSSVLFSASVMPPAIAAGDSTSEPSSNKAIEFSGLVLPVERNGKLINYLFVNAMVTLSPKYDQWQVRETAHVYRDLILKAAHETPVGNPDKPMELDQAAFERLIRAVFDEKLGPGAVSAIQILALDSQKVFLDG